MTLAGILLATGIDRASWDRMEAGELDNVLIEYATINGIDLTVYDSDAIPTFIDGDGQEITLIAWSQFAEKCRLLIQQQLEENCYTNKGNPAGSIFGLKAKFGWQDNPVSQGYVNQTLVIANATQAEKALEMLKFQRLEAPDNTTDK